MSPRNNYDRPGNSWDDRDPKDMMEDMLKKQLEDMKESQDCGPHDLSLLCSINKKPVGKPAASPQDARH
jgi:hypothetical protein